MTTAPPAPVWRTAWLHPAAVMALLAVLAVLGSAYAAVLLQRERIARLEARIAVIEADYPRRAEVAAELKGIGYRLGALERAGEARTR